jgi:hypothetical protein
MKMITTIFILLPFLLDAVSFGFSGRLGALVVLSACSGLVTVLGLVWGASTVSRRNLIPGLSCLGVGVL